MKQTYVPVQGDTEPYIKGGDSNSGWLPEESRLSQDMDMGGKEDSLNWHIIQTRVSDIVLAPITTLSEEIIVLYENIKPTIELLNGDGSAIVLPLNGEEYNIDGLLSNKFQSLAEILEDSEEDSMVPSKG